MFSPATFYRDLKTIRQPLAVAALLFIIGGVLGWLATGMLQEVISGQLESLGSIAGDLRESDNPQWSFFQFIFLNNAIKGVLIIFLGALFGLLSALFMVINGAVIGYLIHLSAMQGQVLFTLIVKGLLPHGIIEIPAIIIACAFGLKFGQKVTASLFGGAGKGEWRGFMRQITTAFLWIVILLLLAAIIESTITFALLS